MTYCKAMYLFIIFFLVLVTVFAASLNLRYHSRDLENDSIHLNLDNFLKKNSSEEPLLNDNLKDRKSEEHKFCHSKDPFGHEGKGYNDESSSHSQNSQETSKQLDKQHSVNNSSLSDSKPMPEPDLPVGLLSNENQEVLPMKEVLPIKPESKKANSKPHKYDVNKYNIAQSLTGETNKNTLHLVSKDNSKYKLVQNAGGMSNHNSITFSK